MEKNRIIYYEELDSTNIKIQELAKQGAVHGTTVAAGHQTAGRGRRGRTWESPKGDNIYMSILLRPQMDVSKAPMLTLVMAYSVAKVLQGIGYEKIGIKWPNDLVLSGKKVCGILTEMQMQGSEMEYVVIGVGVNVNMRHVPEELKDKATSLYLEDGRTGDCFRLIQDIVEVFRAQYERFVEVGDLSFLKKEYNGMLVNRDKEVRVLEPGNEYTAYALGMNSRGELLVRKADGSEDAVFAGEVSVRGIYGYI